MKVRRTVSQSNLPIPPLVGQAIYWKGFGIYIPRGLTVSDIMCVMDIIPDDGIHGIVKRDLNFLLVFMVITIRVAILPWLP